MKPETAVKLVMVMSLVFSLYVIAVIRITGDTRFGTVFIIPGIIWWGFMWKLYTMSCDLKTARVLPPTPRRPPKN